MNKEILGVSVDELLNNEPQTEQKDIQHQDVPSESYTVYYKKDDISRTTWGANKKRMIVMAVVAGVFLLYLVQSIANQDVTSIVFALGAFIFVAILIGMNYLKLRNAIKISEQQTLDKLFQYDVYENHVEQTVRRNGEIVSRRKMQFSELSDIRKFGDRIVFRYANQLFILHVADLAENSRFYWFLRSQITKNKKPKKKGYLTAISVILFVLSIATLWFGLIIAAVKAEADPDPLALSRYL